jgi:iron complex outermembrane recepter protein
MALKTAKLRDAICYALATSVVAFAGTGSAFAQDTASDQEQASELDRVEITGTRIRQVDVETAAPVLTITRAEIEKQGFQSASDILQNISAMGAPPLTRAQPLSAGEAAGGTFISLRNLGAQRTLVLLNGKRMGVTTGGLADVSTIPAVAIERIEVLKDGASSIYGSDAIAGVINIITRTNYEGATGSVYFGQYDQGDGGITTGEFAIGFRGDKGSLSIGAEWGEEEKVAASDRPFSAFPRSNIHPTDGWTVVHQGGGYVRGGTRVVLRPGGNPLNPADFVPQNLFTGSCNPALGATEANGCVPGLTLDKSNTNEQTDLRTPLERKSLYVDGVYDINDNVRFRTNLLYANRVSSRQVAGFPFQSLQYAPFRQNTGLGVSATSYFNPTPGTAITNWWRRAWEVPRVSESDLSTYRFSGGFEGSFDLADRMFDWDVSYLRNRNKQAQDTFGNLNLLNVQAAVGPSFLNTTTNQVQCGTAAAPIALSQCVPWNPFLPFGREGLGSLTNNAALQKFLFQNENATSETTTTVISANLTGSIVSMPAGDLGFAIGYENRKEDGEFIPDALASTGGSTNLASGRTSGSYSVDEIYAELQVPILADKAFANELSLNVASRYSDYDTFGETTNNKFGLKWKPIESLLLRATYADGFRAPTINDLFGGGSDTFAFFTDPCDTNFGASRTNPTVRQNCINGLRDGNGNVIGAMGATLANSYRQLGQGFIPVAVPNSQTPVPFRTVATPTLQPEESKSQTIGVAWSPTFVEGLYMSLDWWKIRIDNTIIGDAATNQLEDCYVRGIAARCLFTRDPVQGYVNTMRLPSFNAGFRKVEGFDFDVSYRLNTDNWGNFRVVSNTTYTVKDYFTSTDDPQVAISTVGRAATGQLQTAFRIRSNLNLGWDKGNFGVSWNARYFSSISESCTYFLAGATSPSLECNDIGFAPNGRLTGTTSQLTRRTVHGSNTFHDVQVRWNAPWDATISVGANNVFERYGPVMYTQPNANVSYYGGFDIGRFWYMRYTQRF